MSKISIAIVDTLLEEITDYEEVELSDEDYEKIYKLADQWRDEESIESEINGYLLANGYSYNDDCKYVKKQ